MLDIKIIVTQTKLVVDNVLKGICLMKIMLGARKKYCLENLTLMNKYAEA